MSTPMTTRASTGEPAPDADLMEGSLVDTTIAEREREVERSRAQLAGTVDALHAKLDVKSRVRAQVSVAQDRFTSDDGTPRPDVLAGAAAAFAGLVALVWWRRR